jgi:hypothetical protein
MRRALASLLLALFSFPLIVPILRADAAPSLPSCCRREGKHHCSMGSETATQEAPALAPVQAKCANYPAASGVPFRGNLAFANNSLSICASLVTYPSVEARMEAQYRVSFSRTRQKRGPPALLS